MPTTETAPAERHWLTKYDPDDGEPYGQLCDCEIGKHHDGNGDLSEPDDESGQPSVATETPATEAGTAATGGLTLTEFLAAQLRSRHILDGRWVEISAIAVEQSGAEVGASA